MDEAPKITPEQADALARRLQGSLQQRRPRKWRIAALVIGGMLVLVGLLVWFFYDPSEPVRLEVIAFDTVVSADETPRVRAQLAFPDDVERPVSVLGNRKCVFLDADSLRLP